VCEGGWCSVPEFAQAAHAKFGRRRTMVNVKAVDGMASGGLSGRAIAKTMGVSEATVLRILRSSPRNSAVTGDDDFGAPVG
jgi:hypothetical protein